MLVFFKNIFYSKKSLLFLEAGLKKSIDKRSIKLTLLLPYKNWWLTFFSAALR